MTNTTVTPSHEWAQLAAQAATERDPARLLAIFDEMHAAYLAEARGAVTLGGLPYPSPTDPIAEGADAIRALAEAVDDVGRIIGYLFAPVAMTLTTTMTTVPGSQLAVPMKAAQIIALRATATLNNSASGNPKTATLRLMEAGNIVGAMTAFAIPFIVGTTATTCVEIEKFTAPADGTYSFSLMANANAASSVTFTNVQMEAISMSPAATKPSPPGPPNPQPKGKP